MVETLSSPESNLIQQMYRKPCIEMEYFGNSVASTFRYVIYGTCDYRRMFRFTAQQTYFACWRMQMTTWDPDGSVVIGYRVNDVYDMWITSRTMTVTAEESNSNYSIALEEAAREPYSDPIAYLHFFNREDQPAKLVQCNCSNQSLVDLWSMAKPDQWRRYEAARWDFIRSHAGLAAKLIGLTAFGIGACLLFITAALDRNWFGRFQEG